MELLKLLQRYHEKLNEYVEAAKTMDEQTFRQTFEKRSRSPAFQQCSAPGHSYKSLSKQMRTEGNKRGRFVFTTNVLLCTIGIDQ